MFQEFCELKRNTVGQDRTGQGSVFIRLKENVERNCKSAFGTGLEINIKLKAILLWVSNRQANKLRKTALPLQFHWGRTPTFCSLLNSCNYLTNLASKRAANRKEIKQIKTISDGKFGICETMESSLATPPPKFKHQNAVGVKVLAGLAVVICMSHTVRTYTSIGAKTEYGRVGMEGGQRTASVCFVKSRPLPAQLAFRLHFCARPPFTETISLTIPYMREAAI